MLRGMKIALDLTDEQEQQMWKSVGVARWSYNYAITRCKEQYLKHLEDTTLLKTLTEGQIRKVIQNQVFMLITKAYEGLRVVL